MLSNDCLSEVPPVVTDDGEPLEGCDDDCLVWWCVSEGTGDEDASIISCFVDDASVLIVASESFASSCTLFAALIRRIGCEHDFPSAQFASGQPHSSCFTSAVWRAIRCFSISWLTIASTVSAVEISISFAVSERQVRRDDCHLVVVRVRDVQIVYEHNVRVLQEPVATPVERGQDGGVYVATVDAFGALHL
uniref:Uncharacterized protein n=1 Tax=Anopheles farauti TaxID=69004 RepID=A0A182QTH9_9DIPT